MKTYTFHVSIPDAGQAWRKVELTGEQTLQDLHIAIQESLEWELDDDIAFFLGDDPPGDGQQYVIFDIVDDEEDFCHLVKLNLETTHHSKVPTAYNVRDGIDMAILDFSQRQGISMETLCLDRTTATNKSAPRNHSLRDPSCSQKSVKIDRYQTFQMVINEICFLTFQSIGSTKNQIQIGHRQKVDI